MTIPLSHDSTFNWSDSADDTNMTEPRFNSRLAPLSEWLLAVALPWSTMIMLGPLTAATVYCFVSAGS